MQFLPIAGFKTGEVMAAMPDMLNLASAGATDLGRAADLASNILSGFGIEASKMGEVADVLVSTFTRSNTTIESLGESFKYFASSQGGWSVNSGYGGDSWQIRRCWHSGVNGWQQV